MMPEPFDVFISYKTEDANEVREVAECLIANGVRTWFAEYEIGADIYDDTIAVQRCIDEGILLSQHAIVFTNDRWANSEYCALEMEGILRKFGLSAKQGVPSGHPIQGNVIEVFIPKESRPHGEWPVLASVPAIVYNGRVGEIIEFINSRRWFDRVLDAPSPARPESGRGARKTLRYGVSIDVGGFVEHPQTLARHDSRREFSGEKYYFERQLHSLTIGLAVNINPFQSALGSLSVPKVGDAPTRGAERLSRRFAPYQEQLDSLRPGNPAGASDRLVYGAYRQYAKTWLDSHDKEDKGIHLFFWNNRSHLAVTSANKETSDGKRYWERRYFIVLFNREDVQVGEVDVSFGLRLPATGADDTRTFCALTRTFDAIAASIQHDPAAVMGGRELVVPLLVKTWLSLLVIGNWLSFMAESPAARPAYLYAGLSGLFSMDLLLSLLSPRFRNETAHLGSSLGPRFRVLPTFGRALDRVWDAIVGTLATIGLTFIGGVVNVVALMIAAVVLALSVPVPTQPHAAWFGYGAAIYLLGFASRSTSSARRRQRDGGSSPRP